MKYFITILTTFVVMFIGLISYMYYLSSELTYTSTIAGGIGIVIVIIPAWDKWKERFDKLFWKREKND
jgi:hypothetical protein